MRKKRWEEGKKQNKNRVRREGERKNFFVYLWLLLRTQGSFFINLSVFLSLIKVRDQGRQDSSHCVSVGLRIFSSPRFYLSCLRDIKRENWRRRRLPHYEEERGEREKKKNFISFSFPPVSRVGLGPGGEVPI